VTLPLKGNSILCYNEYLVLALERSNPLPLNVSIEGHVTTSKGFGRLIHAVDRINSLKIHDFRGPLVSSTLPELNLVNLANLQFGPGRVDVVVDEEHIIKLLDMANYSQQRDIRLGLRCPANVQRLSQHPIFQKLTTLELGDGTNHLVPADMLMTECM
jgi:hypothetical protein